MHLSIIPVTNYVPELSEYAESRAAVLSTDTIDTVNWTDITIGALASQLAGLGRDATWSVDLDQAILSTGLPPVPSSNASYCGNGTLPVPCDRAGMSRCFLLKVLLTFS